MTAHPLRHRRAHGPGDRFQPGHRAGPRPGPGGGRLPGGPQRTRRRPPHRGRRRPPRRRPHGRVRRDRRSVRGGRDRGGRGAGGPARHPGQQRRHATRAPLLEFADADWHRILDTNLTSAFLVAGGGAPDDGTRPRQDRQHLLALQSEVVRPGIAPLRGHQGRAGRCSPRACARTGARTASRSTVSVPATSRRN
ncbi:hypothetical protein LV779_09385 [Streptomyces thinghirensis]|nr:hypothetical protein [Streptomyces thinghirensis]